MRPFSQFIPITVSSASSVYAVDPSSATLTTATLTIAIGNGTTAQQDIQLHVELQTKNGYTLSPLGVQPVIQTGQTNTVISPALDSPTSQFEDVVVVVWVSHDGRLVDPACCTFTVERI